MADERIPSGVPGLDVILNGGLIRGSSNLIVGSPGTGKTILACQIAFHHVVNGGRAVYVTLLTELHGRMFANLRSLSFFDEKYIPESLYFVSGHRELIKNGIDGFLRLLGQLVRDRRATMLVIDGIAVVESFTESKVAFQSFLQELYSVVNAAECTMLLLSQAHSEALGPELVMVESILCLSDRVIGLLGVRELVVGKLRGSAHLRGKHTFEIDDEGITVYPRLEAIAARRAPLDDQKRERTSFGIPRLDAMLGGGVLSGSTTVLLGAPGSGKTLLGLSYLAANARAGRRGLYFGFYETPERILGKGESIGLPLRALEAHGDVEIAWRSPLEGPLDKLAAQLLGAVRGRQATQLFIDGIDAFTLSAVYPERTSAFLIALNCELRMIGVTALFSMETQIFEPEISMAVGGVSAIVENIVFLRYVELRARLHRLISILKVRESGYDTSLREFEISDRGIDIAETFQSAEALLSGQPRPAGAGPERPTGRGRRGP